MKRKESQKPVQPPLRFSYQRASVLDVPLIFNLMQEGAEAGSFSDAFVERRGSVKLLFFVLRSVLRQRFQFGKAKARYEWLVIELPDGEAVGFLKLTKGIGACLDRNLELLAICSAYRNKGIGSKVLEHVASEVPDGARLFVHCTKYARAMQHILKRHQMKRNVKFRVPRLEEYQSDWSALSQH